MMEPSPKILWKRADFYVSSRLLYLWCRPFLWSASLPSPRGCCFAADGGYRHCQAAGLQPDLLLGDFDSLNDLPKGIPIHTFPVEKDDTDTMLAIKYGLKEGYRTFHLYGGTGGRPDHTLANLQALGFLAQAEATGYLIRKKLSLHCLAMFPHPPARKEGIFSLFCLGQEAQGVSIHGAQYPLDRVPVSPFFPIGVSNHFQGNPVTIQVETGCLLIGWEIP